MFLSLFIISAWQLSGAWIRRAEWFSQVLWMWDQSDAWEERRAQAATARHEGSSALIWLTIIIRTFHSCAIFKMPHLCSGIQLLFLWPDWQAHGDRHCSAVGMVAKMPFIAITLYIQKRELYQRQFSCIFLYIIFLKDKKSLKAVYNSWGSLSTVYF